MTHQARTAPWAWTWMGIFLITSIVKPSGLAQRDGRTSERRAIDGLMGGGGGRTCPASA